MKEIRKGRLLLTDEMAEFETPIVVLVTGGSGLVGKAIEAVISEEHASNERWIFASSRDGDLRDKEQTRF